MSVIDAASMERFGVPFLTSSSFTIAEPGADYQSTDIVSDPTLPDRRLIWGVVSRDHCILYYDLGGRGHSRHVIVFRLEGDRAFLAWHAWDQSNALILSLDALRARIRLSPPFVVTGDETDTSMLDDSYNLGY